MNCPKCGESSAVQSTRTIVSGEISNTAGSAVSYPLLGEGALTATYFGSTTTSVLANRLMPPSMPTARAWPWIVSFTTLFVLIAPKAAYEAVFPSQGYFSNSVSSIFSGIFLILGVFIGIILGILFAMIMRAIGNATWMKHIQEDWYPRSERVWDSYYCGRDDLMFDSGYAASPEEFISYVWRTTIESTEEPTEFPGEPIFVDARQHLNKAIYAIQFAPLSFSLGQISFAEAREILKEKYEFPSVSRSIQISRQAHKFANISSGGAMNMLGDSSVADMAFYGAVFPVGEGGYLEERAIAASAALSHDLWEILDDSLANKVKSERLETGPELLMTLEVAVLSYRNLLSNIVGVLPDIQVAADQSNNNFAEVWGRETGVSVEAMTSILHSHRDTLLCADFYRETHRSKDGPTQLWELLSTILSWLEQKNSPISEA